MERQESNILLIVFGLITFGILATVGLFIIRSQSQGVAFGIGVGLFILLASYVAFMGSLVADAMNDEDRPKRTPSRRRSHPLSDSFEALINQLEQPVDEAQSGEVEAQPEDQEEEPEEGHEAADEDAAIRLGPPTEAPEDEAAERLLNILDKGKDGEAEAEAEEPITVEQTTEAQSVDAAEQVLDMPEEDDNVAGEVEEAEETGPTPPESAGKAPTAEAAEPPPRMAAPPAQKAAAASPFEVVETTPGITELEEDAEAARLNQYIHNALHRQTSPYQPSETLQYLQWLASEMQRRSQTMFLLRDMDPEWTGDRIGEFRMIFIGIRALIIVLFVALVFILQAGALGIIIAAFIFLVAGGIVSMFTVHIGQAAVQHFAIRWVLTQAGYMPPNYMDFLGYAADIKILRQMGERFAFMHTPLRDHIAGLSEGDIARLADPLAYG